MANEAQAQTSTAAEGLNELSEFSDILKQTIKPRTDVAAKEVDNAVVALVREALDDQELVAEDVIVHAGSPTDEGSVHMPPSSLIFH